MTIELDNTRAGKTADRLGGRDPVTLAIAGDSIARMLWNPDSAISPLFHAVGEHNADIWHDPSQWDVSWSGSPTQSLVAAVGGFGASQQALVEAFATTPDLLIQQSFQNNTSIGVTERVYSSTFIDACLATGIPLLAVAGRVPSNGQTAADRPAFRDEEDRLVRAMVEAKEGTAFLELEAYLKDKSFVDEQDGSGSSVRWAPGLSNDGTHPLILAGALLVPEVAPLLRKWTWPLSPYEPVLADYDPTNFPYGNVLGYSGCFAGTGGTYNGVANGNVLGTARGSWPNATTAWALTDGNGITATPSPDVDHLGYPAQKIAFSGTASGNAAVALTMTFYFGLNGSDIRGFGACLDFSGLVGCCGYHISAAGQAGLQHVQVDSAPPMNAVLGGGDDYVAALPEINGVREHQTRVPRRGATGSGSSNPFTVTFFFKTGAVAGGSVKVSRARLKLR